MDHQRSHKQLQCLSPARGAIAREERSDVVGTETLTGIVTPTDGRRSMTHFVTSALSSHSSDGRAGAEAGASGQGRGRWRERGRGGGGRRERGGGRGGRKRGHGQSRSFQVRKRIRLGEFRLCSYDVDWT